MGIFDILGPVMVGPSSSHTAGAVRLGLFARALLGGPPRKAEMALHGSFAATGEGHGTHLALLAGLQGLEPDDERIPEAWNLASDAGLEVQFTLADLGEVHPNSVCFTLEGSQGPLTLCGSSVGGGRIQVWELDDFPVELDGEYPTILMTYPDRPGWIAVVSALLAQARLNIATIKAHRTARGGVALLSIQCDQVPPESTLVALRSLPDVVSVRFVPALGGHA